MRVARIGFALTVINLLLLVSILISAHDRTASAQQEAPVLRGRALEILDTEGRVRASITVESSVTMEGRTYPETVLLRLSDPRNGPVVKLTASAEGSSLGLSDDADGGVTLMAKGSGNLVKVVDGTGREQVVRP